MNNTAEVKIYKACGQMFIDIGKIEIKSVDVRHGANDHGGYLNFTLMAIDIIEVLGLDAEEMKTDRHSSNFENYLKTYADISNKAKLAGCGKSETRVKKCREAYEAMDIDALMEEEKTKFREKLDFAIERSNKSYEEAVMNNLNNAHGWQWDTSQDIVDDFDKRIDAINEELNKAKEEKRSRLNELALDAMNELNEEEWRNHSFSPQIVEKAKKMFADGEGFKQKGRYGN